MNRQLGALRRPRPEAYTAPVSPLLPNASGQRPPKGLTLGTLLLAPVGLAVVFLLGTPLGVVFLLGAIAFGFAADWWEGRRRPRVA